MIAPRASICVLLATSIVSFAGGALAAGEIRLAQTSTVTNCIGGCNNAYANCQTSCLQPAQAQSQLIQGSVTRGNVVSNGSCVSLCTSQPLLCSQTCSRSFPPR